MKASMYSSKIILQLSLSNDSHFFGSQRALSLTYGLQQICFPEQGNLYHLGDFWKVSLQIQTIFGSEHHSNLLDVKFKVFKKPPTSPKTDKRRGQFQTVHAIEESAGLCSRKPWSKKTKQLVPCADTYNVQGHG